MNAHEPRDYDYHLIDQHLYDIVQQEGAAGRAYLRSIDTLKCILLRQCPMQIENYVATITDYTDKGADQVQVTVSS